MKKLSASLFAVILVLSTFSIANAVNNNNIVFVRCIVELDTPPLIEYVKNLGKTLDQRDVARYRENLILLHQNILGRISNRMKVLEVRNFLNVLNGFSIKIPKNLIYAVKSLPHVKAVHEDCKVETFLDHSVPLINADDVWKLRDSLGRNVTGRGVTIAIVDTGVDYNHPDLKDSYLGGYDFYDNDDEPLDENGHGTHCAGILVGNGNASDHRYVGVAPDAGLYVYRALGPNGDGAVSTIMAGIERAVDPNGDGNLSDHVDILSLSVGIENREGNPDDLLSMVVDNAVDAGVVVVTAAGNNGPYRHTVVSPACARKVIAVGASTHLQNSHPSGGPDHVAIYSSRGPSKIYSIKPDIVAPGGDVNRKASTPNEKYAYGIVSTLAHGASIGSPVSEDYTRLGGTSMAAPHVAGVAALIKQKHPDWNPMEIKATLRYTAVDIGYPTTDQGFGRVNALAAVNLSSPPPLAFLYATGETCVGTVYINGTATARNFSEYALYYKYVGRRLYEDDFDSPGQWTELYASNSSVDEGVLYRWNTTSFKDGWYIIKLVSTDTKGRKSFDMIIVDVENSRRFIINIPEYAIEGRHFNVSISDDHNNPVDSFIIFRQPFKLPQIHYGSNVTFYARPITRPWINSVDARIYVIVLSSGKIEVHILRLPIYNT
ncbi:MAG: hypothetical protein DRN09_01640 [Thermoplasmata archaeon]|nr:MAG: hypothetical protein DRN09_01640 [Thermoplasmata archaeon]